MHSLEPDTRHRVHVSHCRLSHDTTVASKTMQYGYSGWEALLLVESQNMFAFAAVPT